MVTNLLESHRFIVIVVFVDRLVKFVKCIPTKKNWILLVMHGFSLTIFFGNLVFPVQSSVTMIPGSLENSGRILYIEDVQPLPRVATTYNL